MRIRATMDGITIEQEITEHDHHIIDLNFKGKYFVQVGSDLEILGKSTNMYHEYIEPLEYGFNIEVIEEDISTEHTATAIGDIMPIDPQDIGYSPAKINIRAWDILHSEMIYKPYQGVSLLSEPMYSFMIDTGYTDKNKVSIFDGDIVRVQDSFNYLVEFQDGSFRARCAVTNTNIELKIIIDSYKSSVEVIGNVYENIDLLSKAAKKG